MAERRFRIGLVINPVAGIGGPVALKGSDGADTVALARQLGGESHVAERTGLCLQALVTLSDSVSILTVAGGMGAAVCDSLGLVSEVVYTPASPETTGADTGEAVRAFQARGVDLVLFAGGDGTARDVCGVIADRQLVLGIPSGVKMHSGVFANTPSAAAILVRNLVEGRLVSAMRGEVRDIDETSFRRGRVITTFHGEMWVPAELSYVQHVKSGGREVEALVVQEIAADLVEHLAPGVTYFIGSGSTTLAITEALGLAGTLLGVDVVRDGEMLLADAREADLFAFATGCPCRIVVTFIGGQGHVFGRGNQQFSERVIRTVGIEHITIIGTKSKLEALLGQPLLVDTGSPELDLALSGTVRVVTGYEDSILYPLSC